jgi:hypothetical protein
MNHFKFSPAIKNLKMHFSSLILYLLVSLGLLLTTFATPISSPISPMAVSERAGHNLTS